MDLSRVSSAGTGLRAGATAPQYLAVGLIAGAIIALQVCIMRIFAVGSWAHFGSLVVSLAMLGFGFSSVVIYLRKNWFERRWRLAAGAAIALFGPLVVGSNLVAQEVPFNAIFLVSDPAQKWRLLLTFILYFLPFLAGALFLGTVFLIRQQIFGRVYFADMTGSGLSALVVLVAMYVVAPENLLVAPLGLWSVGGILWFAGTENWRGVTGLTVLAIVVMAGYFLLPGLLGIPAIAVSQYKGVAYARNYPDAKRVYRDVSPFGDLQIYSSSYMHFAPGLSDNAAFNLPEVPADAYLAMFIDGDGPEGIMRDLPPSDTAYFRYLPMFYPYLIESAPDTFVAQFGGGISTMVALRSGSKSVTVAESNPAVLKAFDDSQLRAFTGDVLHDPRVRVIPYEGRLFLTETPARYDVVDLSLADSVGLSNPGGFAIVEKYAYTREALTTYMRALRSGGVLSVTLWNKEEPPKSVLRFYATIAEAARAIDPDITGEFFVASTYLATTTVLYKRGGFTTDEVARLRHHTRDMSFDEIYSPGFAFDPSQSATVIDDYRSQIFGSSASDGVASGEGSGADQPPRGDATSAPPGDQAGPDSGVLPATALGRLAWNSLVHGGFDEIAKQYVFDTHLLTNDRPYFAGYVKPRDLAGALNRLDSLQDDWGYLLIWATFAIAALAAVILIGIPVIFDWRAVFGRSQKKSGVIVYFACIGFGYIIVEVGLISRFIVALGNTTVSATVLITGMLVFSGIGSVISERILGQARKVLPPILLVIGGILFGYTLLLDDLLGWLGTYPYAVRILLCIALIALPAFFMGFPMPTGMMSLARLGRSEMFVWAWGINGSCSVVGAAAVPLIATTFGLNAVLQASGAAYLIALPAFLLLSPAPDE